jgi:hypothetical protein
VYADEANSMGSNLAITAQPAYLASDSFGLVWRTPTTDGRGDSTTGGAAGFYRSLGGVNWYNDSNEVSVSVATGGNAMVHIRALLSNSTAGATTILGYTVGGASTVAATSSNAIYHKSVAADDQSAHMGAMIHQSSLTTGTNVFTLVGYVSSTSGTISGPFLTVIPY